MSLIAPRKILAIKLRALGDTVLMTASLNALRDAYPSAEIHVVVTHTWAPLLQGHPAVDRIWPYERLKNTASRAKALASMALKLRKERYDGVLNFHASPSSATLAFATGAKTRSIHFHGHQDKNKYSTVQITGKGVLKPIIERDLDTVRALGHPIPSGPLPTLHPDPAELSAAQTRLDQLGLKGPVLAMALGASRPSKSWSIEQYAKLALDWCQKTGGSVLGLLGPTETALLITFYSSLDQHLLSEISDPTERQRIRSLIVFETGVPVRTLAALITKCDLFVGNDSGPKHIAVAVGRPTVTLFGPEDPFEWHPYPVDKNPYFFIESLPCRRDHLDSINRGIAPKNLKPWCGIETCTTEKHRCMGEIDEKRVLEKCISLL